MDSQPTEQALIDKLAHSRSEMAAEMAVLREKLNVPRQVKITLSRHPAVWLAGAAVVGLILSQIPRSRNKLPVPKARRSLFREPKPEVQPLKHALLLWVLKSAVDYAKPAAMTWMKQYLSSYASATRRPSSPSTASTAAAGSAPYVGGSI